MKYGGIGKEGVGRHQGSTQDKIIGPRGVEGLLEMEMLWVKFVSSQNLDVEVPVPPNITLLGNSITAELVTLR